MSLGCHVPWISENFLHTHTPTFARPILLVLKEISAALELIGLTLVFLVLSNFMHFEIDLMIKIEEMLTKIQVEWKILLSF